MLPCIFIRLEATCLLGFPAGLFRPGKSWEGPGTGRNRTRPRHFEGPVVPWSQDQKNPKVPGLPGSFFPQAFEKKNSQKFAKNQFETFLHFFFGKIFVLIVNLSGELYL